MIKGLTHELDGTLRKTTKYRGKISTGFAPGEGPNKQNYPMAAGFFRMLKEQTVTKRIGSSSKKVTTKEWVLNEDVQKALESSLPKPNKTPRRVEITCLYKTPQDMWESSLAMYSGSEGLLCKSHGEGTNARYLKFNPDGDREWVDREFDGKTGCLFRECPDFKSGKCKALGLMKVFPVVDMAPNPYRFETRSINTIIGIESALQDLGTLLNAAHAVKQIEAGKQLPFDGFFGANLYMVHKKLKSGGRDVMITDIMPTEEFTDSVMEPIKRGLARKAKNSKLVGAGGAMSILDEAGQKLLKAPEETDEDGPVSMDISDQQEIASQFGADADAEVVEQENFDDSKESVGDKGKEVAETLLKEEKK